MVCSDDHVHVVISGLAPLIAATTALMLGWMVALVLDPHEEVPDLLSLGEMESTHGMLAKFLRSVEAHFVYQSFEAQRSQLADLCVVIRGGPALH